MEAGHEGTLTLLNNALEAFASNSKNYFLQFDLTLYQMVIVQVWMLRPEFKCLDKGQAGKGGALKSSKCLSIEPICFYDVTSSFTAYFYLEKEN